MKKWFLFIIIITFSCTTTKKTNITLGRNSLTAIPVMTNEQLTQRAIIDSIEIKEIKRGYVFLDTMFFKKLPDGTVTFRDSVTFNIGVFRKVYVGIPTPIYFDEEDLELD